jgi:hypothetical protein
METMTQFMRNTLAADHPSPQSHFLVAWRRSLLVALAGLLVAYVLSGCGGGSPLTLTQANLDKIQPDMSSAEVKAILGEPTDSKSEPIPIVGGTKTTYDYTNKDSSVVIILKNDKVQTKEGHFGPAQ